MKLYPEGETGSFDIKVYISGRERKGIGSKPHLNNP
jgi:hypothetical protein